MWWTCANLYIALSLLLSFMFEGTIINQAVIAFKSQPLTFLGGAVVFYVVLIFILTQIFKVRLQEAAKVIGILSYIAVLFAIGYYVERTIFFGIAIVSVGIFIPLIFRALIGRVSSSKFIFR